MKFTSASSRLSFPAPGFRNSSGFKKVENFKHDQQRCRCTLLIDVWFITQVAEIRATATSSREEAAILDAATGPILKRRHTKVPPKSYRKIIGQTVARSTRNLRHVPVGGSQEYSSVHQPAVQKILNG